MFPFQRNLPSFTFQKDNEVSDEELLSDIFSDESDLIDEIEEDDEDEEDDGRVRTPAAPGEIDPAKLQAEIELVRDFISRARSIGTDTKTRHLLTALKTGWDKLKELGAAEKAVVFTESRRSMNFLREYLEANGYADQVVCFSGGGRKDEAANRIYEEYKAAHPEDDTSKPVMMRHALIDAFRNKAKILIATEAGAEGINLQFCSMVVRSSTTFAGISDEPVPTCRRWRTRRTRNAAAFLTLSSASSSPKSRAKSFSPFGGGLYDSGARQRFSRRDDGERRE